MLNMILWIIKYYSDQSKWGKKW